MCGRHLELSGRIDNVERNLIEKWSHTSKSKMTETYRPNYLLS